MSNEQPSPAAAASPSSSRLQVVRSLLHLVAVIVMTVWAFTAWPLPWPGVLTGLMALALTVVIWALFLSPKPVLRTDRFGQSLIELLLVGGAVAAMLALGMPWLLAVAYFVVAAVIGYLVTGRSQASAETN